MDGTCVTGNRPLRRLTVGPVSCFVLLCACLSGCQPDCQFVEMALRARENELRVTREELHRSQMLNEALVTELQSVKRSAARTTESDKALPMPIIKSVAIGRQSGGVDEDPTPGDEAIQVVVEPRDLDGKAVKVPGSLAVEVQEVGPKGSKMPLSNWEVPAEQLRLTWRKGLLSTGYYVILPWKIWPTTSKLHVMVHFTLPEGGMFEADRDVTIRLPKHSKPRTSPPETEAPLPTPRKVQPPPATLEHKRPPPPAAPELAAFKLPAPNWRPPAATLLPPEVVPDPNPDWRR